MTSDPELTQIRESVLARFHELGFRVRTRLLLEGLTRVVAVMAGLCLLSYLLDRSLRLSQFTRGGLLVIGVGVIGYETWQQIIQPLLLTLKPIELAYALDERMAAQVAAILELPNVEGASPALVREAVQRAHRALSETDLRGHLDEKRRKSALWILLGVLLVTFLLLVIRPGTTSLWGRRMFQLSSEAWPQKTYLAVAELHDNAIIVPRGEPFSLRVFARNNSVVPESVSVRYRDGGSSVEANATRFGPNDFRYDFPAVTADTPVEIRGGDDIFGPIIVRPVDRPRLSELKLVTQHPTESQPHEYTFNGDDADLSFLPFTKMQLTWTANTPIAQTTVKSATTQPSADAVQRIDDQHFSLSWTQSTPVRLEIALRSAGANLTSEPVPVSIGLKTDQPPRPTISFSGVRTRITPSATIPLVAEARDDYGIADLQLALQTDVIPTEKGAATERHSTTQPLYGPTRPATELDVRVPHSLPVTDMKLIPGALLTIAAIAKDDCYAGPQTTTSRTLTFRIVTPEELFREILNRQQSERVKFRRQADDARLRSDALATLSNAEAAATIARQHRTAQRECVRIAAALSDTLTEMKLNALGTSEAYELMQTNILAPLRSLDAELMMPQKDALDALKFDDAGAVTAAQQRQQQIVDRMNQILKQMSQWDSFVDVLNQLNEVIRLQTGAEHDTEQIKKSQDEGLFEK